MSLSLEGEMRITETTPLQLQIWIKRKSYWPKGKIKFGIAFLCNDFQSALHLKSIPIFLMFPYQSLVTIFAQCML